MSILSDTKPTDLSVFWASMQKQEKYKGWSDSGLGFIPFSGLLVQLSAEEGP